MCGETRLTESEQTDQGAVIRLDSGLKVFKHTAYYL